MASILIVDDEQAIRRILTVVLGERGHQVRAVVSGEEGLEAAAEAPPELVLLDLRLPGIDGMETMKRLAESCPEAEVVMMTAHGSIRSAVEAMRLGAFDYISKPFDNDDLLLTVERALKVRQLSAEVADLRGELEARYGFSEIVGISPPLQQVFRVMSKVARVDATVLVHGESGTGKELVARAVHRKGRRADGPFVAVNCSAIPQTLVEAEFFGHEKGAFTDAREARAGKFEQADGGTLFLDEIGDLALEAQAKLLRSLQEGQILRLGARNPKPVDVRVIAATNKELEAEVKAGRFREDLYWRLNVVKIELPPLRARKDDLPLLVDHFLERFNQELGLSVATVAPEATQLLSEYPWPGNVRELENAMCRAMVMCEGDQLTAADLPPRVRGELAVPGGGPEGDTDLEAMTLSEAVGGATERIEKVMIRSRLERFHGNRTATAESLGVTRKTLFNKMRQYELSVGKGE